MRDRLVEILKNFADGTYTSNGKIVEGTKVDDIADLIIADGWIRPPCKVEKWMTSQDISIICRFIGVVEGFTILLPEGAQFLITHYIEKVDAVLEREEKGGEG